VINGDAETGPCAEDNTIIHPTGWNYNGPVTQISYTKPSEGTELLPNTGPQ
jgi:hypothetical protein